MEDGVYAIGNGEFDRIMIAQIIADRLKLVTQDSKIPFYEESCVVTVWLWFHCLLLVLFWF